MNYQSKNQTNQFLSFLHHTRAPFSLGFVQLLIGEKSLTTFVFVKNNCSRWKNSFECLYKRRKNLKGVKENWFCHQYILLELNKYCVKTESKTFRVWNPPDFHGPCGFLKSGIPDFFCFWLHSENFLYILYNKNLTNFCFQKLSKNIQLSLLNEISSIQRQSIQRIQHSAAILTQNVT